MMLKRKRTKNNYYYNLMKRLPVRLEQTVLFNTGGVWAQKGVWFPATELC